MRRELERLVAGDQGGVSVQICLGFRSDIALAVGPSDLDVAVDDAVDSVDVVLYDRLPVHRRLATTTGGDVEVSNGVAAVEVPRRVDSVPQGRGIVAERPGRSRAQIACGASASTFP